jgi:hypothetical protein
MSLPVARCLRRVGAMRVVDPVRTPLVLAPGAPSAAYRPTSAALEALCDVLRDDGRILTHTDEERGLALA